MVKRLADYRREYGTLTLRKSQVKDCAIAQFESWFQDIVETENYDPTAMLLSTVDHEGQPDSRVVLLKGIMEGSFVFYTNYSSAKAKEIENNNAVSLNFFWPFLSRQIRIKGKAASLPTSLSDDYFASRPRLSRIAAHASNQSAVVSSRQVLEKKMNQLISQHGEESIIRPAHWGGYRVIPMSIEFWQGRDNRLHDRLRYIKKGEGWNIERLEP